MTGSDSSDSDNDQTNYVQMICPITLGVFEDPVRADDGIAYDRAAIEHALQEHDTSPSTGVKLETKTLKPDSDLRKRCKRWRRKNKRFALHNTRPELETLNSQIFMDFDAFEKNELLAELGQKPPTVIVMGNESTGKSTTLERLCGFPVLPRAEGVCTRMVIRVTIRRSAKPSLGRVGVFHLGADPTAEPIDGPSSFLYVALAVMCEKVKELMDKCVQAGGQDYVTDKEIRVMIQVPYAPNLNIIDLPGFIATGTGEALTREIATTVITAEREHAMCVLVNDARHSSRLSVASRMVEEHDLAPKTLGIFTFMDLAQDVQGGRAYHGAALTRLLSPGAEHTKWAGHGWIAIGSRCDEEELQEEEGVTAVARLHQMNDMEQEMIEDIKAEKNRKTGAPTLAEEFHGMLGVGVARQRLQRHFESLICKEWVPGLKTKLYAHWDRADARHEDLGLPMPNDKDYVQHLGIINRLVHLVPGYDVDKLRPYGDKELAKVLLERVSKTVSHEGKDWLGLGNKRDLFDKCKAVADHVGQWNQTWGGHTPDVPRQQIFYLNALSNADKANEDLCTKCVAVRDVLSGFSPDVAGALCNAVFSKPPAQSIVQQTKARWDKFWKISNISKMGDEEQAGVGQFGRLRGMRRNYEEFVAAMTTKSDLEFVRRADELIAEVKKSPPVLHYMDPAPGSPLLASTAWANEARFARLADALLDLWLREVVRGLVSGSEKWVSPSVSEECKPVRIEILRDMVMTCETLDALRALVERVGGEQ